MLIGLRSKLPITSDNQKEKLNISMIICAIMPGLSYSPNIMAPIIRCPYMHGLKPISTGSY
jgi:hypothetical protein